MVCLRLKLKVERVRRIIWCIDNSKLCASSRGSTTFLTGRPRRSTSKPQSYRRCGASRDLLSGDDSLPLPSHRPVAAPTPSPALGGRFTGNVVCVSRRRPRLRLHHLEPPVGPLPVVSEPEFHRKPGVFPSTDGRPRGEAGRVPTRDTAVSPSPPFHRKPGVSATRLPKRGAGRSLRRFSPDGVSFGHRFGG